MEEISRLADQERAAQDSKGAASPKVPFTFHPLFALFQLLILSNSLLHFQVAHPLEEGMHVAMPTAEPTAEPTDEEENVLPSVRKHFAFPCDGMLHCMAWNQASNSLQACVLVFIFRSIR